MNQPFLHLSYQWQVIDKIATPKSPYESDIHPLSCSCEGCQKSNNAYLLRINNFEQFAAAHKMETDAPDGVHDGSSFKEVWQFKTNKGRFANAPSADYHRFKTFGRYRRYWLSGQIRSDTRQFLEYIGEEKEEEKPAQIKVGESVFTKLVDGWMQIVTKNGCVELCPEEIKELIQFVND